MLKKVNRIFREKYLNKRSSDKKKEYAYFPDREKVNSLKKLFLIIGPESTATRLITRILSQHPDVLGTLDASEHVDVLDDVWRNIEAGEFEKARKIFLELNKNKTIITRRSMPHSLSVDKPADYMNFPDIYSFYSFCLENELSLYLFITTRSPIPAMVSSKLNRDSVAGSLEKSKLQYMAAYMYLFEAILKLNVPFSIISLEALLNDKQLFVNSLFEIMGLDHCDVDLNLKENVNEKQYSWYSTNRIK